MFGVWIEDEKRWCRISDGDTLSYKVSKKGAIEKSYWFKSNYPAFDYAIREHQVNCIGDTSHCCDGRYDISTEDLKNLIDKLEL